MCATLNDGAGARAAAGVDQHHNLHDELDTVCICNHSCCRYLATFVAD